jgi:hypothetical protein
VTLATEDDFFDALANNSSRIVVDKASLANAAAGQFFSMWTAGGVPGAGATPTTAKICTRALTGALGFAPQTPPATSYIGWLRAASGNATQSWEIHDRVADIGGLNGTLTTAQTVNLDVGPAGLNVPAERRGDTNYSDMNFWLEVYTALGSTGVNATVNVTYDDGTTGNLAAIALGATPRAGRLYPLIPAVAGSFIRAVNSVTLSATTGAAGNFGVTVTRPRTGVDTFVANKYEPYDWRMLGVPQVPNDSCLQFIALCSTTATGTLRAQGKIAHG